MKRCVWCDRSTESGDGGDVAGSRNALALLRLGSSIRNVLKGQSSQEVCPHNSPKFVGITSEEAFWPREGVHGERLIELMGMDQAEFSRRFKGSPVKRAKRRGLLRNVAVALGNWGSPDAVLNRAGIVGGSEP